MKRQTKGEGLLWKRINKENNQQINEGSIVFLSSNNKSEQHRICTLLPQVQNRKQDFKQLDDFINQIQKSGVMIEEHDEVQHMRNIVDDEIEDKNQKIKQNQICNQLFTQSIVQKLNFEGEFTNIFYNIQKKNICCHICKKIKYQLIQIKKIIHLLHEQIINIRQNLKEYQQNFQLFFKKIQVILNKNINTLLQTNKNQQNKILKDRVCVLENKIKQKQQQIKKLTTQLQNIKAQNFQLVFDLNQKIEQADIIIQQKVQNLIEDRIKKVTEEVKSQVIIQQLNFNHIQQKTKYNHSIFQIDNRNFKNNPPYKINNPNVSRNKTTPDDSQTKQRIETKLFTQQYQPNNKNFISIQNTQSNLCKNENEINKKIEEIRKKYKTSKPNTPVIQANVYRYNNHQINHNKSQVIYPSIKTHSSSNNLSFLNTYHQNKNMIKKVGSPRNQIIASKGFNSPSSDILTNLLNKNPQRNYCSKEKQIIVENRLQNFKIDRLGNRIDELRNQIKRQIQASK